MTMKDLIPNQFVKLRDVDGYEISIAPINEYYYAYSVEHDLRVEGDTEEEALNSMKKMVLGHGTLFKLLKQNMVRQNKVSQAFFYFANSRFKNKNDKTK